MSYFYLYSIRILQPKMNYPGNKNIPGLIHSIVNQIPVCQNFYEPFAGSAAVSRFLSVLPGRTVQFYITDLDPAAIDNIVCSSGMRATVTSGFDLIDNLIKFGSPTDDFIFIDPPYHHSTRPAHTDIYKKEFSHADHVKLLKSVLQLKCNCMIIHPVCDLYD